MPKSANKMEQKPSRDANVARTLTEITPAH
jgi:hypothetical protein